MSCTDEFTAHLHKCSNNIRNTLLSTVPGVFLPNSALSTREKKCPLTFAPPRTPEMMTELSTKAGWLVKRNEQNIWQKQWCCIVPQTYLYVFNEGAVVKENNDNDDANSSEIEEIQNFHKEMQPVAIIDLETYSSNEKRDGGFFSFELSGDSGENSELRTFDFKAQSKEDMEQWSEALLYDRYSVKVNNIQAYKQACEGTNKEINHLRDAVESAHSKCQISDMVTKNVRMATEKCRSEVNTIVRKTLEKQFDETREGLSERSNGTGENKMKTNDMDALRARFISSLDKIEQNSVGQAKTSSVIDTVKLLADFTTSIIQENEELKQKFNSSLPSYEVSKTEKRDQQFPYCDHRDDTSDKCKEVERAELSTFQKESKPVPNQFTKKKYITENKLDLLVGSLAEKEQIWRNQNSHVYESSQRFEAQIAVEQEKKSMLNDEIHFLRQHIKLQASIIDSMRYGQNEDEQEDPMYEYQRTSDELEYENECIFSAGSECIEDRSALFPHRSTFSIQSNYQKPIPKPVYERSAERAYYRKDDMGQYLVECRSLSEAQLPDYNVPDIDLNMSPSQDSYMRDNGQFIPRLIIPQRKFRRRVSSLDM